jgi:hypothetical protein
MRCVLTINFNNALCENSRESMREAAGRWGAYFWEVNESSGLRLPIAPNCHKCAVFERSSYEEVFILDADVVVSSKCPNPFDSFTNPELVAVANGGQRFGDLHQVKSAESYEVRKLRHQEPRLQDAPYDPKRYFNTGMMLARREHHAKMFKLALDVCHTDHGLGWCDQTPLNLAATKLGVNVHLADERWNYIHGRTLGPGWMDMTSKDVYIYHFAGEPGREHVIPQIKWK